MYVYRHAIQNYQERVQACSDDDARAAILSASRGIKAAASIGCEIVRLANGARLILHGEDVITVYGRDQLPRQLRLHGGRGLPAF